MDLKFSGFFHNLQIKLLELFVFILGFSLTVRFRQLPAAFDRLRQPADSLNADTLQTGWGPCATLFLFIFRYIDDNFNPLGKAQKSLVELFYGGQ